MYKIIPHISEKSVILAKKGYFTVKVPWGMQKGSLTAILKETFKLDPIAIKVLIKKTIQAKKGRKTVSDRGIKKMVIKLPEKQIMPGYESFLTELIEQEKKEAKAKEKKVKAVK